MKRRLKRWVKVVLSLIIVLVLALISFLLYLSTTKNQDSEPQIEYGEIFEVEIRTAE